MIEMVLFDVDFVHIGFKVYFLAYIIDCNIFCKDANRNEPNCVGFAREKAQTMSFVERGFERLGLDH